jgi:hypothetical protein
MLVLHKPEFLPMNDNYYFTAVFNIGVPLYLRDLTLAEAQKIFDSHENSQNITFYQYGVMGAANPLGFHFRPI